MMKLALPKGPTPGKNLSRTLINTDSIIFCFCFQITISKKNLIVITRCIMYKPDPGPNLGVAPEQQWSKKECKNWV